MKALKIKRNPGSVQMDIASMFCALTFRLRPLPHYTVFKQKRHCFVLDTAAVHTTTPKTISENGSILKRSPQWNDLETVLFETDVFQVWTAKKMVSENDDIITTTQL